MNLEIIRGDSVSYTVTFSDGETPINLTGATVFFTVKRSVSDADADALITKNVTSHTHAAGGITLIGLTPTATSIPSGTYVYDLQLKDSGGNVFSSKQGKFTVVADVTRRTA